MFLGATDLGLTVGWPFALGQFAFLSQGNSFSTTPAGVHLETGGKVASEEAAERARAWLREQMEDAWGLLESRSGTLELLAGRLLEAVTLYADEIREVVARRSVRPDTKDA